MSRACALVVAGLCAWTSAASGQAKTAADAAFKRGRELLKAGKYADACVELEHSQKLDPALGTEFNIAQCSEKIGKLARALALYRHMVPLDANSERKKIVVDAIPKLEARVPKLLLRTPAPEPAGLVITIRQDDAASLPFAANQPVEVDFGEYTIVVKSNGAPTWTQTVRIDAEAKTTTLEPPFASAAPIVRENAAPGPQRASGSRRKRYGYVALGVGGATLVTGVVFGAMASSRWADAKDVCGGTTCATAEDLERARELGDGARTRATLSTVFVVTGTAAAAAGILLFVTAPDAVRETHVTAVPTHDGGAITLSGRF